MKWLLLLFPISVWAGFSEAPKNELYQYQKPKKSVAKGRSIKRRTNNMDKAFNKLMEEDRKIAELLKRQEKNVIIRKSSDKIIALTRVKGLLLNSVLAMNVKPSKFIVRIQDEREEISGGEIRCVGYSFEKRVPAHCNLLVVDGEEYQIDVDIWDLDGAEGIIADYFYSGEEKAFLTSSFASFLQGVLDVAKDRVTTPFGEVTRNNAKNKVLGGLVGVAGNVREKVAESGEKKLTISYVNSGKEVLVFFNQTLNMDKERKR